MKVFRRSRDYLGIPWQERQEKEVFRNGYHDKGNDLREPERKDIEGIRSSQLERPAERMIHRTGDTSKSESFVNRRDILSSAYEQRVHDQGKRGGEIQR